MARHLLDDGWRVRGMTRDPSQPEARRLADAGAEVVQGDFDDRASVEEALAGVDGVFAVQSFQVAGVDGEIRQGRALADAAAREGVEHFVQSSVEGADRRTGIPHFESKWKIEVHVRDLALPSTFLRPVFFMDNFTNIPSWRKAIEAGTLPVALSSDTPLQMVAVDDIGAVATLAFDQPERFRGEAVGLAGDQRTPEEIATVLSESVGRPLQHQRVPFDELRRQSEEMAVMFEWFEEEGYQVDIDRLRDLHPGLQDFEEWCSGVDW